MNYLGIDCGSVSVKMVVLNDNNEIIANIYLANQGIKDTIMGGLTEIKKQIQNKSKTKCNGNISKILNSKWAQN